MRVLANVIRVGNVIGTGNNFSHAGSEESAKNCLGDGDLATLSLAQQACIFLGKQGGRAG